MEFCSGGGGVRVIPLPLLKCCKVALDPGFIASIQLIRSSCMCVYVCERWKKEEEDKFLGLLHHTAAKFPFIPLAQLCCTHIGTGVEYPWGSLSFEVNLKRKADSFERVHCYLGNMGQQHLGVGLSHLQEKHKREG